MDWLEFENLGSLTVAWTIRISMICLFCSLCLRLIFLDPKVDSGDPPESQWLIGAKNLWLLGSFFALLHAMAAMIFVHQGSHVIAMADTARQTKELLGVSIGFGIYFNYAFVTVWVVDAIWWISSPRTYINRKRILNWMVYGFLIFIAINGTIIFETGRVRWLSLAGLTVLILLAIRKSKQTKKFNIEPIQP